MTGRVLGVLLVLAFSGCASGRKKPASAASVPADIAQNPAASELDVRNKAFKDEANLETVFFGYDQAHLSGEARSTLQKNAQWIKAHPGSRVLVTGHCDQRGTIEYNLALGQRRAEAVREYYRFMGISASRLATQSLGKEAPVCDRDDESCGQKNRRAESKVEAAKGTSRAR